MTGMPCTCITLQKHDKAAFCHSNIRGRGEQSIDVQREDNKKRGGRGQGAADNAWGDHDTGSKSQSGGNFERCRNQFFYHFARFFLVKSIMVSVQEQLLHGLLRQNHPSYLSGCKDPNEPGLRKNIEPCVGNLKIVSNIAQCN